MWSTTQIPFLYQRDLAEALGHLRRPHPGHPAAGGRELRPRPRPLPDRHHRRAPGPARPAAGEDRVRPRGGVRREPDPRAVRLHAPHRGAGRRDAARPRRPGPHRQRRLRLLGIDDALRHDDHARRLLPLPEHPVRHRHRLHEQRLLGLDARLRQPRVDLRRRGPDGRPRRAARAGPPGHPAPQREPPGGRDARRASGSRAARSTECFDAVGARHRAARRAAAPPGLAAGHRLRRDVPRGGRRARVPLGRLRGHRQARRLREGHADHRCQRDRAGIGDGPGDDRRRGAGHPARAGRGAEQRHRASSPGTWASTPAGRPSSLGTPRSWRPGTSSGSSSSWPPSSSTSRSRRSTSRTGTCTSRRRPSAGWRTSGSSGRGTSGRAAGS